jgi:hypothetical protein
MRFSYEFLVQTGYGKSSYSVEYAFDNMKDARNFYNSLHLQPGTTSKKRFLGSDGSVLAREGYDIMEPFNVL